MGRLRDALGTSGDYSAVATPWLFSGDLRTILPFALNRPAGSFIPDAHACAFHC
jgi:hypothetical protein